MTIVHTDTPEWKRLLGHPLGRVLYHSEGYPSAGDLRGELDAWDALGDEALEAAEGELDIIPIKEGKRSVVSARKVCDARWASALATHLAVLGMAVEVRAEIEGAEERAG